MRGDGLRKRFEQMRTQVVVRGGRAAASAARTGGARSSSATPVGTYPTKCGGLWIDSASSVGSGFGFSVSLYPTQRTFELSPIMLGATSLIWTDLQHCVPFRGLNGTEMDSMFKQLQCHVIYAWTGRTGATFDLEAWRPDVSDNEALNPARVMSNRCNWKLPDGAGSAFIDHIVQWSADAKSQKTSWLVVNSGGRAVRHWIPTSKIYSCLKAKRAPGPEGLEETFLSEYLPDETGVWVTEAEACGSAPAASAPAAPTTSPPPSGGGGSPSLWNEQEGSLGANTFLNPYNASGMGVKIQPYQWVAVSCKVYAPQIVSANPDGYWYRIASSPWDNAFYAVANTFWNGDVPGVLPYTHNTDFTVPNC
jgi:hypothetical protein